ncbi:hypothetical protein BTUL_0186g00110 [Botrytis tulipae]|uniref:Heterokaryon incompatibility domain-containing protein n=1 Tax=Botrytis tulipae TaxID=87230 RepID=A0A4Z1EIK4_9HELO|nr:hypothetical protein BTUL_0186g00110 [Botrytis tulipae]
MANTIYRPLNNTRQEIRVIKILPAKSGRFDEALALDDLVTGFTALSYTWGDVVRDEDHPNGELIARWLSGSSKVFSSDPNTVDGVPVNIGKNILDALRYFRYEASVKTTQLTSPQKPRFTLETCLWADALCSNQEDLTEGNQQELAAIIDSFGNDHWNATQSLLRSHNTKLITILQNLQLDECWEALDEIHKSPYWNRLWIVQEVLSNSETWVYVGE